MHTALNRISTGYKINDASDDAAGMVISKALETQTRGLDVANKNAQMAVNLLSVADGALGQMGELTMRIRDLATQSANGVYSERERESLILEARELTSNLEQLARGTKFNEYNIFEGTSGSTKGIITEAEAVAQGYEVVKTAEELKAALHSADALNNSNKKVMLFGDINLDDLGLDATGSNWEAVGDGVNAFKGMFDGNGFTISNLKMDKARSDYQGLFGYIDGATIKNVGLENIDVKGQLQTGGLVGRAINSSTIQNSYVTGSIIGTNYVGGLVGGTTNISTIQNSYFSGDVKGNFYTGGLVGEAGSSSTIQNSYSTGSIVGGTNTGGLIGGIASASIIENTYSTSNVTGSNYTGGLIGVASGGTIQNCYSTGDIFSTSAATAGSSFGGFIGRIQNSAKISNSYSAGQNKATIGNRGGFIGDIAANNTLTLNNYAYATQSTAGVSNINGVGPSSGTISGTQQTNGQSLDWFTQTSNIAPIIGAGSTSWDFSGTSPVLAWQIPPIPKNNVTFQIGTDGSSLSSITMALGFGVGNFKPDFSSATSSRKTMEMCDNLLKTINTKRGEIGANANIISSIVDGNTITGENLTASKSRIQDADIARESANMVKNQILESATSSLLAQSTNISGQLALQLLSGISGKR